MTVSSAIRVLVVDDSALVRRILSDGLARFPDIEIIGTAPDAITARDLIVELEPDVVTLDIEMPGMDGLSLLRQIMKHRPLPVIIVSSLSPAGSAKALEALEAGAFDVVGKPGSSFSTKDLSATLIHLIRQASREKHRIRVPSSSRASASVAAPSRAAHSPNGKIIIAIGASTGGTEATREVLAALSADAPPILIVQHMPAGFTAPYAKRLNESVGMEVREACHGDQLHSGCAWIAPGGRHMILRGSPDHRRVELTDGPLVHFQRPSVDVLFQSVAKAAGADAIGVLLTGMGSDGAKGLRAMKDAGAHTLAQDEATCAVFGMPRAAISEGAVDIVAPLSKISALIEEAAARKGGHSPTLQH
ncbi:MAG: chemotaxis response regulator protein-glutamate methylesterase [Candidatus Hydrogenedentota bacterium]